MIPARITFKYNYLLPWYTHDLSVQKLFKLNKHQLKASFEVNNLFNQYYDVVLNYPMPDATSGLF